ncbi:carbohydrate binding family 9 domain-containing protein [Shewanella cyperi]|uniref:Carbohydrate binding family 9 domain-containing protein n=1 Tax=Shewanella cyperi TaxID=2814292 RepID=A0A974XI18_9GAMM|nr:carbohydrate binding family 9 domain-containing protein [Shewanella cyperi]QSX28759.1 carbohydrate binding family 9 domain-containing protein [Shewanella cyperi]
MTHKKTSLWRRTLLAGLLPLAASSAHAGLDSQFSIQIPTIETAANIDGELDDAVWAKAGRASLTYETRPSENGPAPVATEAFIYASKDTLYVAFEAKDPNPDEMRAHLRARDDVWGDDLIGIKLDTFNSAKLAYQFFVNPLGVQLDSIENELTKQESAAWDGIWYSAGTRTATGYRVEMALPLTLFSFDSDKDEQEWGIELIRFYPRNEDMRFSTHKIARDNNCQLCQLGVARGLEQAEQGKGIQLTPSLVAKGHRSRGPEDGAKWQDEKDLDPGLDMRWAVTPSTLVNATLNPDFSQVEADAGQLDVNTTFALFYDEKRAFFLDNKDYFDTRINLLHTRNIADPDYGLKLTSKTDQHTFALLGSNDTQTHFLVPGNLGSGIGSIDKESINLAGRYRFDAGNHFALGGLVTTKSAGDYHNTVASVDLKYQLTEQDAVIAQVVASDTRYPEDFFQQFCRGEDCSEPDSACTPGNCALNERVLRSRKQDSFGDRLFNIKYEHNDRNYYLFADYIDIGEDFRADLGFVDKVDFRKFTTGGNYVWYPESGPFNKIKLGGDWDRTLNQAGEQLEQELEGFLELQGGWQSYLAMGWVNRDRVGPRLDGSKLAIEGNTHEFNETQYWFYGNMSPLTWFTAQLDSAFGDEIDQANNRLGRKLYLNPTLTLRLTEGLSLKIAHTFQTLDVDEGRLFTANLSDLRLNWQLSIESFIRLSAIYTHVKREPSRYLYFTPDRLEQHLGTELLYGYKLNPFSVFYLGYSDAMSADDNFPGLSRTDQTVFMKLSYAWAL